MSTRRGFAWMAAVALVLSSSAGPSFASTLSGADLGAYSPEVPVSALARPAAWFDPSRLSITTSVAVGSGFGGGTQGMQTTSLTYRFDQPVWMRVSVGNAWGSPAAADGKMFLEGLDLGFKPFSSLIVNIQYRDFRSPLQYSQYPGVSPYSPYWGW